MNVNRFGCAMLVIFLSLFVAAGCGNDDEGDDEPTTTAETTPTETTVAPGAGMPSVTSSRTIALPGEQVFPEGVALDAVDEQVFVSSTTDGTIFTGDVGAKQLEPLTVDEGGPTAAVGLAIGPEGALFVAGGTTGNAWRIDTGGGDVTGPHTAPGTGDSFINDVAVTAEGTGYFTDSMRPAIYKLPFDATEDGPLEVFADLSTGPIEYEDGFNLNGIELTPDEKYLFVVQSNTGKLYRVPTAGGEPEEVDLGGETLDGGDGLEIDEHRLYVVQGDAGEIAVVDLSDDWASGEVGTFSDDTFALPTTLATADDGTMYVVNSQFDKMDAPELPFTISALQMEDDG